MLTGLQLGEPGKAIAIFVDDLGGGGAEKVAVILANALVRRGERVHFIMRRAQGCYLSDIAPEVTQIDLSRQTRRGAWDVVKFLARYLREARPVMLFAHMEKPSLLAIVAGQLARYRRVVPCVHTDLVVYAKLEHSRRRTLLLNLVRLFYPFSHAIVAVSEGTGNTMRRLLGWCAPPVHVVKNGFDLAALRALAVQPPAVPWLRDKSVPVIVSCGRLVPQKAFNILLRGFALLRARRECRLVILGEGPMRAELEALAVELGIVPDLRMPGFVANPMACFGHADLFVLTSQVEGLSNVLIEALASGAPIVSTDCPSGPREVLRGGRFGVLTPVDDPDALAQAMQACLQGEHPVDGSLPEHLQTYAVETMVEGYMKLVAQARAAH